MAIKQGITITTNANKVIDDINKKVKGLYIKQRKIMERVCEIFVERARLKLVNCGYKNLAKYANNIKFENTGTWKWRVYIEDNQEKPIMYFLEFGTGFVGGENPHHDSVDITWKYAVNENKTFSDGYYQGRPIYFDMTKPYNERGLYSDSAPTPIQDSKGWIFKDPKSGRLRATSGLRAVSYLYNTMQEIPDIIEQAKREVNLGE